MGWSLVGGGRAYAPAVGPFALFGPVLGGGVCYKVAPAGGAAPGPSTLAAATGCPRYELSGALTGWVVRVRLGEALGGCLLTSTGRVIFYQPVWY